MPKEDVSDPSGQGNTIGADGRYRIERKLGNGAMGAVFLAKDQLLLRDVALKRLTAGIIQDHTGVVRFQQEARALAQLSHPRVVQIYDFLQVYNVRRKLPSWHPTFDAFSVVEVVANCDHLKKLKFSASLPYVFTEHGAIMAASVLNSKRAIEVSVFMRGPMEPLW